MGVFLAGAGINIKSAAIAVLVLFQLNAYPFVLSGSNVNISDREHQEHKYEPQMDEKQELVLKKINTIDTLLIKQNIHNTIEAAIKQAEEANKTRKEWIFKSACPAIWADRSKAELSLTFDDGVDYGSAAKALEVLKKTGVKCTFFVIGRALAQHPQLWQQAVKDGHQVCNHTQNHKNLAELSNEEITKEIKDWESSAGNVLGEEYLKTMRNEFPFFRLPYGSGSDSKRIMNVISELKYIPVGWSAETYNSVLRHYNLKAAPVEPVAARIANHITANAKNGSIILLHFNAFDTAKLQDIIEGIKAKGLSMKLVSEVLADN
ncbi:MAG: polysaccharide deacetylase family protein [Clostridia bacterium]|nr:polysaccharide deacetylase family protein [Clostridia bacterium]